MKNINVLVAIFTLLIVGSANSSAFISGATLVDCDIHGSFLGTTIAHPNESYKIACFNRYRDGQATFSSQHKLSHGVLPTDPLGNQKVLDLTLPHCFGGVRKIFTEGGQ